MILNARRSNKYAYEIDRKDLPGDLDQVTEYQFIWSIQTNNARCGLRGEGIELFNKTIVMCRNYCNHLPHLVRFILKSN